MSCALLADGTIKCWGNNAVGQLGDTTTTNRNTPVSVSGISNAIDIAIGNPNASASATVCAVLSTGGVKCWGYGGNGQL